MNTEEPKTAQPATDHELETEEIDRTQKLKDLIKEALPFLGVFPEPVKNLFSAMAEFYVDYYSKKLELVEYQIISLVEEEADDEEEEADDSE